MFYNVNINNNNCRCGEVRRYQSKGKNSIKNAGGAPNSKLFHQTVVVIMQDVVAVVEASQTRYFTHDYTLATTGLGMLGDENVFNDRSLFYSIGVVNRVELESTVGVVSNINEGEIVYF